MGKSANFTECGLRYMNDPALIARYNYSGPVRLIPPNPQSQITYEGCKALCGTGNEWYEWSESSQFITTWVLPILGTLLQAPFESNAFFSTVKATCRWLGSPIASLSWILWNIEISGKCALFVDMAIPYSGPVPDEDSDFACLRDSFYLLMNTNQYQMKWPICMTKESEGLLRIILFSKDLRLLGSKKTLKQMRRKLAQDMRSNRKRGVVPVFISTLWFLFSLGISIQAAFGYLGDNAQAHYLAIGLLMGWFPVLILCTIIDRNPIASDDIRRKINRLVDLVCVSLQDEENRREFIDTFRGFPEATRMAHWVQQISEQAEFIKGNYFTTFAGQARLRFHYGAAHAILLDIEKSYIADHGRNWLADERNARLNLVLGQTVTGLVWFDGRQFWQMFTAIAFVIGTGSGAFILSYFTPTVGLSCRSGGYLVFGVVALGLLFIELYVWMATSPIRGGRIHELIAKYQQHHRLHHHHRYNQQQNEGTVNGASSEASLIKSTTMHFRLKRAKDRFLQVIEDRLVQFVTSMVRLLPSKHKAHRMRRTEDSIRAHYKVLRNLTLRQWTERCFFFPVEAFNTIWLTYLIVAQTTGGFVNCACQTSIWGYGGGYMDFTQWQVSNSEQIGRYWTIGTAISCAFMGLGMIYTVLEWCLQSHLSTENYQDAMQGLQRTRQFRRYTHWIRYPATVLVLAANTIAHACRMRKTHEVKSLVWTKDSRHQPQIGQTIMRVAHAMHQLPFHETDDKDLVVSSAST